MLALGTLATQLATAAAAASTAAQPSSPDGPQPLVSEWRMVDPLAGLRRKAATTSTAVGATGLQAAIGSCGEAWETLALLDDVATHGCMPECLAMAVLL